MRPLSAFFVLFLLSAPLHAQLPQLNLVHSLPQAPPWLAGFQARWPVRIIGDPVKQTAKSVLVSIPTGGWLKPDASDLAVQTADGKLPLFQVVSHDPSGETIIQFQRQGNDPWYWVYGANPKAPARPPVKLDPTFMEGVTVEVRDWAGDDLTSWAKVRAGLEKSPKVTGNAIVGEVLQTCNPAKPDVPQKFAASYRGFLNIKKPGAYRFLVNADDASFLFIDGFKVFERAGTNKRLGAIKVKDLEKLCGKVDLKEGVHPFEVHQVVGANPDSGGVCALLWSPPGQTKFTYLLTKEIKQPIYARCGAVESAPGTFAPAFVCGIEDTLLSGGLNIFLVRFEAVGPVKEGDKIAWDFGDGTSGVGRAVHHVYLKEGDYPVSVKATQNLPPFRRLVRVWPEPGEASPLSLGRAVKTLEGMDWKKLGATRIRELFAFLTICEEPNRYALLDQVAQHLLEQKEDNLDFKSQLYAARLDALAHLGKAADALKLAEQVRPQFKKTPVLEVRIQLAVAAIHQDLLKDAAAASKIYKNIMDEHSRTEHPFLRLAGIRWGDLFAESGDMVRAAETYRMAATLGGEKFTGTALTDATTRGAMLRIAEQKLKAGDIHQTRQLLEKIELNYPGQRIDGLYCFLRAEADRYAGRYEDALRYYEMILKLPQWAGYRDRALFGIANSYFRMEELEKAGKWFGNIKEAFPKFYEKEKIADLEKLIEERQARLKAAKAKGSSLFKGYSTGFEPDEPEWFGAPAGFDIVAAPGIQGPHVAMLDIYPQQEIAMLTYTRPFKNLTPGGTYWAEIWYKDVVRPAPPLPHQVPFLHVYLTSQTKTPVSVIASANIYRNSHHWHRLGCKLKVPLAQDYELKLMFYNQTGIALYDSLSLTPVSDRQVDSLHSFYEGPKMP
jgi:tetratricopeptide (TPR) repeat protein